MTLMEQAREMHKTLKKYNVLNNLETYNLERFSRVVGLIPLTSEERRDKRYKHIEQTMLKFKSLNK